MTKTYSLPCMCCLGLHALRSINVAVCGAILQQLQGVYGAKEVVRYAMAKKKTMPKKQVGREQLMYRASCPFHAVRSAIDRAHVAMPVHSSLCHRRLEGGAHCK